MYKRYVKKSPEILVMEWDGKDETLEGINTYLCSKREGSSAVRSTKDTNLLKLTFTSVIGTFHSFHVEGDCIVFDESEEMPYKKLYGCTKEELDNKFTVHANYQLPDEMSKERLQSFDDFLTAGKIKDFLIRFNIPDSAKVVIERVPDSYYKPGSWDVYFKDNEHTHHLRERNKEIESGEKTKKYLFMSEEEMKLAMTQYHPAFCCAYYKNDPDILFINLHY
jgi:hypothetical protein